MNHQLVQEALESVPQSEDDRLEVLKWAIALVHGQEKADPRDDNLESETDTNSLEVKRSDSKESNEQVDDRNGWPAQSGRPKDPTESTSNDASAWLNIPTWSTSKNAPVWPHPAQLDKDDDHTGSPAKKRRITDDPVLSLETHMIPNFDPASLVTPKVGHVQCQK